jgi:RNA 2',3'-cyclic 3'-phosphodiesterase
MRLFIAINLPSIAEYIQETQLLLSKPFRPIVPSQAHLTLKFLGDVTDEKAAEIKKCLSTITFSSFSIRLGSIGFFPDDSCAKVAWIGIQEEQKMIQLQKMVDQGLSAFFPKEKEYRPHITIGRSSIPTQIKSSSVRILPTEIPINSFSLMQSSLTAKGPVYAQLAAFQLNNGAKAGR